MSFWSEATPLSKGLIIFGVLGLLYMGIAYIVKIPPFIGMPDGMTEVQTRGITPQ